MPKFLLDENLSPQIVNFLKKLGHESTSIRDESLKGAPDEQIVDYAMENSLTIVTADLDFGEAFFFSTQGKLSVILLRAGTPSRTAHQELLQSLHDEGVLDEDLEGTLIVTAPGRIRRRMLELK